MENKLKRDGQMIAVKLYFYTTSESGVEQLPKKHAYNMALVNVPANNFHGIKSGSKTVHYSKGRSETESSSATIAGAVAKALKHAGIVVVENPQEAKELLEAQKILQQSKNKLPELH